MKLPAIDLGLMAAHLAAHEGVINKLKIYERMVNNRTLKKMFQLHISFLRDHVVTMLNLIDPVKGQVKLPEMGELEMDEATASLTEQEKDIALEAKETAKHMAEENFTSALMMKNMNVKHIHIQMAYQDVRMQALYNMLIEHSEGEFTPMASEEMQAMTLKKYQHVLKE
ncbi:MAG TPA: hypothetical protein DCR24_13545 [Bacillus bacterium]|nr:hypothetical protein [Bacillus sp. (in: firmicutes)]